MGSGGVGAGVDPELDPLPGLHQLERAQRGIEAGRSTTSHQAEAERPVSCETFFLGTNQKFLVEHFLNQPEVSLERG